MAVPPGDDAAGAGLGMLPAGRVTAPALRGLARFADSRGVPDSREFWLDYDVIEAFCVAGLAGRASSTRGTYRSALYRLAEAAGGPAGQRATPFAGARAPAPYSPADWAAGELPAGPGQIWQLVKENATIWGIGYAPDSTPIVAKMSGSGWQFLPGPAPPPGAQHSSLYGGAILPGGSLLVVGATSASTDSTQPFAAICRHG